jgi:hypothetical protein
MRQVVERQIEAKGQLCGAIFRLMVDHRYSLYDVRDAVDLLTGELHRSVERLRLVERPEPRQLTHLAFGCGDQSTIYV